MAQSFRLARPLHSDSPYHMAAVTECGKVAYLTKAQARKANGRAWGPAERLRAYYCDPETGGAGEADTGCGFFHNGHIPKMVIQGVVTANEWYGRRGNPCYRDVLLGCLALVRNAGGGDPTFHRGRDGSWSMSAMLRATGTPLHTTDHADPVAATATILSQLSV